MKKLIYILLFILSGCGIYIKNPGEYPAKFKPVEKHYNKGIVYYWDETGYYYIYTKKDKLIIDTTYTITPIFLNKYLKIKK